MGVGGQCHGPDHFTPWKETWYPLYMRLGGPQPICTGAENLTPIPLGFNPQTVQPVANHYTDNTILVP